MELAENHLSRNQIISEYLPYVKGIVFRIASHLPSNAVEIDDLISAGIIGLIGAIEGYDPSRSNKFLTYAVFRIKGAVMSELRSRDFLSRACRSKVRELENTYLYLEQKLGRKATDEEAAMELGLDLDEFYQISKMSSISFVSLEDIGYTSKKEKEKIMNYLVNGDKGDALTLTRLKEIETVIAKAIDELPAKVKLVVSLYYWDELTMREIGEVLDLTESRVSQIHSQAIIHLRGRLKKAGVVED